MTKTKRVIVVGGGPAGAATAIGIAKISNEYDVQLFEAYPHPDKITKNSPKAYAISMARRGQQGLIRAAGIEPASIPRSLMSVDLVRHAGSQIMQRRAQPSLIVSRQALAAHLLNEAEKLGVKVHLERRLENIDFEKRQATFASKNDPADKQDVSYDLLIGSDGSKSKVRALMHNMLDDFSVLREEVDSMEYQVAVVSQSPFPNVPGSAVHAWNNKEYNSITLAFPLAGTEPRKTLFAIVFPEGMLDKFQKSHNEGTDGYKDPLNAILPDLPDTARSEIIEQLSVGQPANGGLCVWCNSLGSPEHGVVLVGDSAHGMWPSLGQGANCALETAAVFVNTVKDVDTKQVDVSDNKEWPYNIIEEFNKRRHADVISAVDLTYGGIGARKSRGRSNAPMSYKFQVGTIMLLHKITLGLVPKPGLIRLMGGDVVSYTTIRQFHFYYEKLICVGFLGACVGLFAFSRAR